MRERHADSDSRGTALVYSATVLVSRVGVVSVGVESVTVPLGYHVRLRK